MGTPIKNYPYQFRCPYCNQFNTGLFLLEVENIDQVIWCDKEQGGCDKQLVLSVAIKVIATPRKITDQEEL